MSEHELVETIRSADRAINARDLAAMLDFYEDDATLVVEPGRLARGKPAIRAAFEGIFRFFHQQLEVTQRDFHVIEGGGVALVICNLTLRAGGGSAAPVSLERQPTYVFRRSADGRWRCAVDNSYGVTILGSHAPTGTPPG